jgi:hypothetical protein
MASPGALFARTYSTTFSSSLASTGSTRTPARAFAIGAE